MKSVRDARGQGPIPVVPILPPRPSAPAWDCYSPVALVLWRAADFAEAGSLWPISDAFNESLNPAACREADALLIRSGYAKTRGDVTLYLRQLAEFGPAGRPRA